MSCESAKFRKMMMDDLNHTEEYIDSKFLVGEWKLDSIIGSKDLIEEWVYFTDEAKFWRYSFMQRSYLVEGDLDYKFNFVMHGKRKIGYRLEKVDTNHVIMTDSTHTKFQLTRWSYFTPDLLETYRVGDSLKQQITGLWRLDSMDIAPGSFPTALYKNYCSDLRPGSKLLFSDEGEAIVINIKTHTPCKQYIYKVFEGYISFEEFEVDYSYSIMELDEKHLVLAEEFGEQNIFYFSFESE